MIVSPLGTGHPSNHRIDHSRCHSHRRRASGTASLVDRYYDPATGQFLSVDPAIGITGQPYAYTGGDPVNETDPTGLEPDEEDLGADLAGIEDALPGLLRESGSYYEAQIQEATATSTVGGEGNGHVHRSSPANTSRARPSWVHHAPLPNVDGSSEKHSADPGGVVRWRLIEETCVAS